MPRLPTSSSWEVISTGLCWCPGASGCTPTNRSQCSWGRTRTSQTDTEPICPPDCASKGESTSLVCCYCNYRHQMGHAWVCWAGLGCATEIDAFFVIIWNVFILCAASSSCPMRRWISGVICWASYSSFVSVFTTWPLFCPPSAPPGKTMSSTRLRSSASRYWTWWFVCSS